MLDRNVRCEKARSLSQVVNRRTALVQLSATTAIATTAIATGARHWALADEPHRATSMGLVIYDFNLRRKWLKQKNPKLDLFEPLTFLKHCQSLGAGGMQANLGVLTPQQTGQLRDFADQHSLFMDAIVRPPKDESDLQRFESEIKTARDVQVQAARTTILPGRRYERFKTLQEFREFERRGQKMLELAAPILEKYRVRFAVENHKDQRIDERVALFEHLDCEFIGACVDTGNSLALLDGPYEAVEALSPYAFTVHLKDQALQEYTDGFLLGDVPLGQGSLDLKRMVRVIESAKPGIRFALELITRDALKVPCLTQQYWTTFPSVPGSDLARAMRHVRQHPTALQKVGTRTTAEQVELESENVLASLKYAQEELGL